MTTFVLVSLWLWAIWRCLFAGEEDPLMEALIAGVEAELGCSIDALNRPQTKAAP